MSQPGANNAQGSRPKYTRVANACEKCKQVRKKCSNTVPCHQCVSKGLQCRKRAPPPTYRSLNAYSSSIEGGRVGSRNQVSRTIPTNQSSNRLVHDTITSNLSKKLSGLSEESLSAFIQQINSGATGYTGHDATKSNLVSHRPVQAPSMEIDSHSQWPMQVGNHSFASYEALTPARTRQSSWAHSMESTNTSFSDGNQTQVPSTKTPVRDTFPPLGFSMHHLAYPSPEQTEMPANAFTNTTVPSQADISPTYNAGTAIWHPGNTSDFSYPTVQGVTYNHPGTQTQVPILQSQGRTSYANSGRTQYEANINTAASAPYTEVSHGHMRPDDQFYTNFGIYGQPISGPVSTEMMRYSPLNGVPPYMTPISPTTKASHEIIDFSGRYQ